MDERALVVSTGEIVESVADDRIIPAISDGAFKATATGLVIYGEPSYEECAVYGANLNKVGGAIHWLIGDLAVHVGVSYGKTYKELAEITGYEDVTIKNDKYVAENVKSSRRRDDLSYGHHVEVASLTGEEQEYWLPKAKAEDWSIVELRYAIRDAEMADRRAKGETLAGSATVALGDAIHWLEQQDEYDLLLTDPPYSTDIEDVDAFARSWLPLALSKLKPTGRAYVFIGPYPEELLAYLSVAVPTQVLVWTYRNRMGPHPKLVYKNNWQAILYYVGEDAGPLVENDLRAIWTVQDFAAPDAGSSNWHHEWEKPAGIAERFVLQASEIGDVVADPFAGSGTFLVAAARLGRIAIGCDNDQEKVTMMIQRGCTHGQ